ncbi:hypothetical protein K469DRAFT_575393 [Zopfia rhizophila CBS 207.26]|uniref:Uncharacterized protein n=1 Tax=Zopfia rhizophila CBS 207.26 TaxID=1314779 RepID=A0A6A6E251_9PEZI|nr:hypothetical protein K469DRAFT_575393 [Zopfia rhizophila CBS 207.26]
MIRSLVLSGVTSSASAISLANFTPRIENLPAQCQAVYTRQIAGCQAGDFSANARCSKPCIDGLVAIQQAVSTGCGNVDVPETSIIGVFLLGVGIPALCPGIEVTTIRASSTSAAQQTSTQAEASSTEAAESSSAGGIDTDTNLPAPPPAITTLATSVVNTPDESIAPPTSTASQPQPTFVFRSSSSAKPTATASSQKSNSESGGGSPFDVQAVGEAASHRCFGATMAIAMILCWLALSHA